MFKRNNCFAHFLQNLKSNSCSPVKKSIDNSVSVSDGQFSVVLLMTTICTLNQNKLKFLHIFTEHL